jgi:hypothetical protein
MLGRRRRRRTAQELPRGGDLATRLDRRTCSAHEAGRREGLARATRSADRRRRQPALVRRAGSALQERRARVRRGARLRDPLHARRGRSAVPSGSLLRVDRQRSRPVRRARPRGGHGWLAGGGVLPHRFVHAARGLARAGEPGCLVARRPRPNGPTRAAGADESGRQGRRDGRAHRARARRGPHSDLWRRDSRARYGFSLWPERKSQTDHENIAAASASVMPSERAIGTSLDPRKP